MKISHRQLSECQGNPTEWVSNKVNPTSTFRRPGYEFCLREGICRFHRDGDVKAAREYTQKRIQSHKLNNKSRIQNTLMRFDAYMNWFKNETITTIDSRIILDFSLGHGLTLGGIISRVDMTPKGYRAILLEEIPLQWEEELRMPLIQRGLALTYGRPEDEFVVGIQELDASDLAVTFYSKTDIDHAEQIGQQLAKEVAKEIASRSTFMQI